MSDKHVIDDAKPPEQQYARPANRLLYWLAVKPVSARFTSTFGLLVAPFAYVMAFIGRGQINWYYASPRFYPFAVSVIAFATLLAGLYMLTRAGDKRFLAGTILIASILFPASGAIQTETCPHATYLNFYRVSA